MALLRGWTPSTVLPGLALSLCATACWSTSTIDSDEIEDQEGIYGEYRVGFDQERGQLSAHAQFRVGDSLGDTVRLRPPSEVHFEGEPMDIRDGDEATINLSGTFYYTNRMLEMSETPERTYTFTWTTHDGAIHDNVVEMADPIAIVSPVSEIEHSRADALVIEFDPPVGDDFGDESVTCWMLYVDPPPDDSGDLERVESGSNCVFSPDTLEPLGDARMRIFVERRIEHGPQQGHEIAGAELSSTWESPPIFVELVP